MNADQMALAMLPPVESFSGEFAFLSNFYAATCPMRGPCWDPALGDVFPTSEHAFQAAKVEPATPHYAEHYQRILEAPSPGAAKALGSQRGFIQHEATLRKDWEQVKVPVMLWVLRSKFRFDGGLARKLMDTSPRALVECNTWGDTFWGVTHNGGKNMLGKCLMLVRAEIVVAVSAGLEPMNVGWLR